MSLFQSIVVLITKILDLGIYSTHSSEVQGLGVASGEGLLADGDFLQGSQVTQDITWWREQEHTSVHVFLSLCIDLPGFTQEGPTLMTSIFIMLQRPSPPNSIVKLSFSS